MPFGSKKKVPTSSGVSVINTPVWRLAESSVGNSRFFTFVLISSIASVLLQASLILVSVSKLPPQLPIFYSMPWGEKILAAPFMIWILPASCGFVFVVNYFLATFWVRDDLFLMRVLLTFSFLVSVATFYDLVKIVSLLT